ncbi:PLP-dependent aminotransferase family protein [Streptomyces turgidiscabies]|uniref:Aminotransferase, class I/II n=2 Tax=Streptomyces turgidiscabies TaxID=85558 RepID=L7ETQ9_STRT8|nr:MULTISPECIES: PLP-dependent aminotransferase family protein [Streptomyces]ELP61785.1 aminotransferase, class I/II [Streptomyces turgidiscabies Car8]MDX3493317.1 PLP-dependent aminotransferase family protein [Streptomyces turgidiscabies]BAP59937.1 putative GntR family transcpriptional regulator [Streptomyces turgidiscabies]GAQ70620.1 2-aminoadipate transaminase [Streptomyces turgidiscabies]
MLTAADLHPSLSDPGLSVMSFLNEATARYPDAVSFASGRPHEQFFELGSLEVFLARFLDHLRTERGLSEGAVTRELLQYGATSGIIRELIATMLRTDEQISVDPRSVVVTTGCQEALLITLRTLFGGPDDALLVASPCYAGVTGAALLLGIRVEHVPEGPWGLAPEQVLAAVKQLIGEGRRPRALYVVPEGANPGGTSLGLDARKELIALAQEYDFLLIEDHAYAVFAPAGSPPSLKALDDAAQVIHIGTFSKSGFPGLRLGYVVADQALSDGTGPTRLLADALSDVKSMVTVNTSPIAQAIAGGMLLSCGFSLRKANAEAALFYRENLATAHRELTRAFSAPDKTVSWNRPESGFFMVVSVPFEADDEALERSAHDYQVLWTPMRYFQRAGGERKLRLSLSYLTPAEIRTGISRLANFIEDERARQTT